jgi:hypothetical protein
LIHLTRKPKNFPGSLIFVNHPFGGRLLNNGYGLGQILGSTVYRTVGDSGPYFFDGFLDPGLVAFVLDSLDFALPCPL